MVEYDKECRETNRKGIKKKHVTHAKPWKREKLRRRSNPLPHELTNTVRNRRTRGGTQRIKPTGNEPRKPLPVPGDKETRIHAETGHHIVGASRDVAVFRVVLVVGHVPLDVPLVSSVDVVLPPVDSQVDVLSAARHVDQVIAVLLREAGENRVHGATTDHDGRNRAEVEAVSEDENVLCEERVQNTPRWNDVAASDFGGS